MTTAHAASRPRGAPQFYVTVTTPRAVARTPSDHCEPRVHARAYTPALQPLRLGDDVFMVPTPAVCGHEAEQPKGPSAAERVFLGIFEWIGSKLDRL